MTPLERQFELKKAGYTQKRWAEEHGVNPMSVCHLIYGKMISNRLMRAFSKTIGKNHTEVFPEYYLQPPKCNRSKVN